MTDPAFIISALVLFVFCLYMGFTVGSYVGKRAVTSREYWKYNIIGVLGAVLLTALVAALPLLMVAPLGLLGGWIAGLKMGFGESVGPWKLHDKAFNVNRGHRETAEKGTGEARRRRARTGEKAPDLISVSGDAADSSRRGGSDEKATNKRKKR